VENLLPKGMLGTQRRTVVAGVLALVLAIILLLAYLNHYRSTVKSENAATPVLRAKVFIPAGTTALALARRGLFEVTALPKDQLREGAITDAAALHGQVALTDVYPGQQLTIAEFGVTPTSTALSGSPDLLGTGRTQGSWRAIALSVDTIHGLSPQTQTGDRVDVYSQAGDTLGLLMQNVLVLAAPNQAAAGTTATTTASSPNYVLRVPTQLAARFAYAQDNAKLWFVLRPQKGAKPAGRTPVSGLNFSRTP
jgi:Flp pilus assembly protein CpaB